MIGAIALAVILVVVFPVAFVMSGALGAALLGFAFKETAEQAHEGSELIDLNR